MAYTTINKSSDYFSSTIYTGNGSAGHSITGVGHQPDFTWIKNRSATDRHHLYDAVRGVQKRLRSDTTAAEATTPNGLTSFNSDGFTVGTEEDVNTNNENFASWNWKAGTGQGSSNTDGTINSTYTSANTTSGFSIVSYTGNGTAGATVGHGLGVEPKVVMVKSVGAAQDWRIYLSGLGSGASLILNTTGTSNSDVWNNTAPTSSVFSLGTNSNVNSNSATYVAYCFAPIKGFSKFGVYDGNGNTDGAFVYTGFKPAWVLIKNKEATEAWFLYDNKRGLNGSMKALFPDENAADGGAADNIDLLSNGFKLRTAGAILNSAANFVYLALAEAPLVGSNNVPATAR